MEISGKVFFLTGAAKGIGRGAAEAALKRGAKVFITDIDTEAGELTTATLKEKYGDDKVRFAKCDVTDKDQFAATFQSAVKMFGHIDVMVNNAGIINEKRFELAIATNFTGCVIGTNLALQHMRKDKGGEGGVILNMASCAGLDPMFSIPVYTGTKSAIIGFTRSWAMNPHISSMGVRLACLCPGGVETSLLDIEPDEAVDLQHIVAGNQQIGRLSITEAGECFMKLAQDDDNNGKMLLIMIGREPVYVTQINDPPTELPQNKSN